MSVSYEWRGEFHDLELNELHAEAFERGLVIGRNWTDVLERHSLGWVVAREDGELVGFVNVIGDGLVHAWLQDTMVANAARNRGIGRQLVQSARASAQSSGCQWLHVDYDTDLRHFYEDICGFAATSAGLLDLS